MSDESGDVEEWGLIPPAMDDAAAQRAVAAAILLQSWRGLDDAGRELVSVLIDRLTRSIEVKEGARVTRIKAAD